MIGIIYCGSEKVKHIKSLVNKSGLEQVTIKIFDITKQNIEPCTHFIISGAPILLKETNPSTYFEKIKILLEFPKPTLGICLGHQLLGMYFGATISKCKEDKKFQRIQQKQESALFEDLPYPSVSFREDHTECISLPTSFHLLASSLICNVEAMQHNTLPFYGVQFHPEVSGEMGIKLMHNFFKF